MLDLEGKLAGLYFSARGHRMCCAFTPKLVEFYKVLKEKRENFEVVMISIDNEEEDSNKVLRQCLGWPRHLRT